MKKIMAIMLCFVLILALAGCEKKFIQSVETPAVTENAVTMQGKILEIENGKMIVEPVEGSAELRSSDKLSVPMVNMESSPEPQVGSIVEITYDGNIAETYPAMIDNVYHIEVMVESMSSGCKELNVEGVKICLDSVTYTCTGEEVPVEPEESLIEYVEIPVGGDSTIKAFARIHEGTEEYLVCQIGEEWYRFIEE